MWMTFKVPRFNQFILVANAALNYIARPNTCTLLLYLAGKTCIQLLGY